MSTKDEKLKRLYKQYAEAQLAIRQIEFKIQDLIKKDESDDR